jgi:hypothetical protein
MSSEKPLLIEVFLLHFSHCRNNIITAYKIKIKVVEIILRAKSINCETGDILTTFEINGMPKFLLAEHNTHRLHSRNAASSRAVPVSKMLKQVLFEPYMPVWTRNQKGMQGKQVTNKVTIALADFTWLMMRLSAVAGVKALNSLNIHKQDANRGLEPYALTSLLVSATNFENFYALRDHEDAQPALKEIAHAMKELDRQTLAKPLGAGNWHKPYEDSLINNVSRAASISYFNHAKDRTDAQHYDLFNNLVTASPIHASPLEHIAMAVVPGQAIRGDENNKIYRVFDVHNLDQSIQAYHTTAYQKIVNTANFAGFLQGRQFAEIGAYHYLVNETNDIK